MFLFSIVCHVLDNREYQFVASSKIPLFIHDLSASRQSELSQFVVLGSRLRPKTLQAVDVPVIDNRLCERWHKANGINVIIYDEMMCAGYRGGGKDSCQVNYYLTFLNTNKYYLKLL